MMSRSLLWEAEVDDWEKVSTESYQFVIEQAKERLDEVINESHTIVSRSMTLLLTYITVLSGILGFVFSDQNRSNLDAITVVGVTCFALFSIYIFTLLFALIASRHTAYKGSPPKEIFIQEIVEHLGPEHAFKILLYIEMKRIQDKIERIQFFNRKRMKQFRAVLKVSLFFVALFVFALVKKAFSAS